MTDLDDLIAEARTWPRDGVNESRLINALADALADQSKELRMRRDENRVMDEALERAERGLRVLARVSDELSDDVIRLSVRLERAETVIATVERIVKHYPESVVSFQIENALASYKTPDTERNEP